MNSCEFKSQLTAYLLGELPEREAAALSAHLAACPECRATADELRATLALLNQALEPAEGADSDLRLDDTRRQRLLAVHPERARPHLPRWFFAAHPAFRAAAAAVVVICLVLYGVMSGMKDGAAGFKVCENTLGKTLGDAPVAVTLSDGVMDAPSETRFGLVAGEKLAKRSGEMDWSEKDADVSATQPAAAPEPAVPPPPQPATLPTLEGPPAKLKDAYADRSKADSFARKALSKETSDSALGVPHSLNAKVPEQAVKKDEALGRESRMEWKNDEKDKREQVAPVTTRGGGAGGGDGSRFAPEATVRLKIDLPKPRFMGTPSDVRSPNLETAQDRLEENTKARGVSKTSERLNAEEEKQRPASDQGRVFSGRLAAGKRSTVGQPAGQAAASQAEAKPAEKGIVDEAATSGLVLKEVLRADADDVGTAVKRPVEAPAPVAFNPFVSAAAEPFSTFAMDVDTASYTLARQAIRSGAMPEPERVRTEEIVNAFDYGDAAPQKAVFRVYQDGAQSPFGAGYHLLRIGVKGRRLGREEQRPAMLTFVVDVSGSMAQPDRIGLARMALASLLDQLAERDRIQLIAYSDHARVVLEPVGASEKAQVMAAFERLQCNGSTNLEEGLRQAYEQAAKGFVPGAENRVILISDGVANLGAGRAQEILDQVSSCRKQGITCSVFGVGAGTYNDRMLEELANKGDGVYRFLDSAEEVRTAFVDDLAATLNTIAKDAKIQVEWNPRAVRQYRQLGYENRALRKEQFRDDAVDAGEVGSGQSVTALYELEMAPDVTPETRLGTVRIRYQSMDTGKVEEVEAPLVAESVLRPAHAASARFRVAACAAEFAELLRGSPYAAGGRYQDVADYLRPAVLELPLDTRVKELLELIAAMAAIKGR